jgi:hypothetical protein
VQRRRVPTLLLVLLLLTLPIRSVSAAPRDNAASEKIDEAINVHYLATEFDTAESVLKGTVEACADRCSPGVKARAWMYIGIVRGSGKQNLRGAQEAFQQALALDPRVALDDALATPQVREAFDAAAATLGQGTPASTRSKQPTLSDDALEGDMECTPTVREVETNRAIPVACTTDEPANQVTLRYKVFGSDAWVSVSMKRTGEYWTGEIPCSDTGIAGKLRWFVRAQDASGDTLDNYGSKKGPAVIDLVTTTDEDPPNYPGQAAPPRCMDAAACPEDMIGTPACPGTGGGATRGNKGWGAPCDTSVECESGLICLQTDIGRTCESAPACDADSDCPSNHVCRAGTCDWDDDGGGGPAGPYKKNWIGLHFGVDFAWLSGQDVCSLASQNAGDFSCFYGDDTQFPGNIQGPGFGGEIGGGLAAGTMRLMGSYERMLTDKIGASARLGFAFNGGPQPQNGAAFLPVHVEVRGQYWFSGVAQKGFRPFVNLGGGVAQVDAKLSVRVVEDNGNESTLDAYKKLGQVFLAGGGGVMYAISENHGPSLNLNLMMLVPSSGFVVQPTIGYTIGL